MKALITGGAGFIGSNLVDALVARGDSVTVVDSLVSGKKEFISGHLVKPGFSFVQDDLRTPGVLDAHLGEVDVVFHMAAAVDVRRSADHQDETFGNNISATYNVLESVRKAGVKTFVFPSSGTVFGEARAIPTPEDYGPLEPISFYGASKAACEAMISAYSRINGFNAVVYRFANIIGKRGTHGVIRDFILKLRATPNRLEILGDGKQDKSYLHVDDCVRALLLFDAAPKPYATLHVGSEDATTVTDIGKIVVEEMGLDASQVKLDYTGGSRGWPGDIAKMRLDVRKLKALGWKPEMGSSDAVHITVRELLKEI